MFPPRLFLLKTIPNLSRVRYWCDILGFLSYWLWLVCLPELSSDTFIFLSVILTLATTVSTSAINPYWYPTVDTQNIGTCRKFSLCSLCYTSGVKISTSWTDGRGSLLLIESTVKRPYHTEYKSTPHASPISGRHGGPPPRAPGSC